MTDEVLRALLGAQPGEPLREVQLLHAPWHRSLTRAARGLPALAARALRAAGSDEVLAYAVDADGAIRPAHGAAVWLAPSWILSAGRHEAAPLVERLVAALAPGASTWRLLASAKDKALLFIAGDTGPQVVRLPRSKASLLAETRAYETLSALAHEGRLIGVAPRPLGRGQVGDQAYFVEQRVAGRPVAATLRDADRAWLAAQAEPLLAALNPGLAQQPLRTVADGMDAVVRRHVRAVAACLSDSRARESATTWLLGTLLPARSRLGRVHGDFSAANVFVHEGQLSGVIDWEDSLPEAPPVLDVLNHLDSMQRRCQRLTLTDTVPSLAQGQWPNATERDWLDRAYADCGVADADRRAMVLLYWLLHVGPQLTFADSGAAARRQVAPVLERLQHA